MQWENQPTGVARKVAYEAGYAVPVCEFDSRFAMTAMCGTRLDVTYYPKAERCIRWNNIQFEITWLFLPTALSDKDRCCRTIDEFRLTGENSNANQSIQC